MIVERVWAKNFCRNFNYIVVCPQTGDALAIDPCDPIQCLERLKVLGWNLRKIVNTHEHQDHIDGNSLLVSETGAEVLAHHLSSAYVPGFSRGLASGDSVNVGTSVELFCLDTPGHTLRHICLMSKGDVPVLFSGDTLFHAGTGNCLNGGNPQLLYKTFYEKLVHFPENVLIYPGHDYLWNNLHFTLQYEPGNLFAKNLLASINCEGGLESPVFTMGEEKQINLFFRLDQQEVIDSVCRAFPGMSAVLDSETVFLLLRRLRDVWKEVPKPYRA